MKFRKKPVVIEATQWFKHGDHPAVGHNGSTKGVIQTLEGPMTVTPGDWIITGVKGEHYPCKPDIFEATYEAVSEPQERTTDYLEKCPNCNGPADNGFDRSWPDPNPYFCTKCMKAMEY